MIQRPSQIKLRLKRLIMLRLLVVTIFLCFGVVAKEVEPSLVSLILVVLALSALYSFWLAWGHYLYRLGLVQIACDLLLECALIRGTAGVDSVFTTLMLFTVFSASIILSPAYGFRTSVLASVLFLALVVIEHYGETTDWLYVGYITYVKISILLLVGFLATAFSRRMSDMENQIRLNQQLSLLGEMTAQLAHEIRNPLMSISGSVELIRRHLQPRLSPDDQRLMENVAAESDRLTKLLGEILNYSHQEECHFERASLTKLLDEVFLTVENSVALRSNIELRKPYRDHASYHLEIDRNKIKQVLLNMLLNGVQALGDGGVLEVDSERRNGSVVITVRDSGCGMSSDQVKKAFVPFTTARSGGTGIGLALAQKIVRQHGGQITVQSKKGRGSVFSVTLPVE